MGNYKGQYISYTALSKWPISLSKCLVLRHLDLGGVHAGLLGLGSVAEGPGPNPKSIT